MVKDDTIRFDAIVLEVSSNRMCRVQITDEKTGAVRVVNAYIAGKFEEKKIKIFPGNKVSVEFSIHNFDKGRIVEKYREPKRI